MPVSLLGIPYDADSSWHRGAAAAPAAIREELARARHYSNMFAESGEDLGRPGLLIDAGDVPVGEPEETRVAIGTACGRELHAGHRLLSLGGDHSVTYPILRAVHHAIGRVDVLHIDAHPDLYPEFEGNRFSHACPFARALEDGLIGRLVQVGIRTQTAETAAVAERYGVEQFLMRDWAGPPRLSFERPVYLSVDVDGIDPACAPGVSHREPGGLSVRDVLGIIQRVEGRVVAGDLVEYNPTQDLGGVTAAVCVKLLKELVARLHLG